MNYTCLEAVLMVEKFQELTCEKSEKVKVNMFENGMGKLKKTAVMGGLAIDMEYMD